MKTSSYEEKIIQILVRSRIKFIREKTFEDLKNGKLRFDFYLLTPRPVIIEVDGQYHFQPIRGRAALQKQKEYDRIKNSWCLSKQIPLYRIPYWEIENITSFHDLVNQKFLVISKWHNDFLQLPQKTRKSNKKSHL